MKDEPMNGRPTDPARRGPGRPPGSRNVKPPSDNDDDIPDEPVETKRICGMEFSTRRNGTFPPAVVRKVALAQQARGMTQRDVIERMTSMGVEAGITRLYNWIAVSGAPNSEQANALSEILDVSLDYLVDDNIPESDDPPRRRDYKAPDVNAGLRIFGLNLMDLERYFRVIATAKDLEIEPGQAVRILISGWSDILEYRKEQARKNSPGYDERDERARKGI